MTIAHHPAAASDARARAARRTSRAAVRNPMLALPGVAALRRLDPDVRTMLRTVLAELADDARDRGDESWRRHKAPMAAYWKAVAVYAGHLARALR